MKELENNVLQEVAAPEVVPDEHEPQRKLVHAVHQDLLGRAPTESAARDWVAQLTTGASASTLATCLLHSQEKREKQVHEHYLKLLGRTPNAEAVQFWTGLLGGGKRQEEVLAALLGSNEYFFKGNNSVESFIRNLYIDIMGRRPSTAEIESWAGLLHAGLANRLAIAYDFLNTDDYRITLLKDWFWKYLRRAPDPQSISYWLDHMKHGMTQESVQAALLASREYFGNSLTR